MSYPQSIEYNDAVQSPSTAFSDPTLKSGEIAETPLGLPLVLSGGFALTYSVRSSGKRFAVRCFHKEVPAVVSRYTAISNHLRLISSPYFVEFDFQEKGICVGGKFFPVVKMDWIEGDTLGVYLDRHASNPSALANLRRDFTQMASFLEAKGIAHGDIQNENVIVTNGALRLIDYDGMFVPGMSHWKGSEVGQKHFQHPLRDTKDFGPSMDRFSFILIDVSLQALIANPNLHRRFREGGQAIIFKANDFSDPQRSEIFNILRSDAALKENSEKLAAICEAPIEKVPSLEDFLAGRNLPTKAIILQPTPTSPGGYIGAYPVLDARDFDAVVRRVGDKVELVGRIVSVKSGVAKRGKGKGKPFIFINFGPWNKTSVKVTIWSEGLMNMTRAPDASWVGKYISVVGLVDPPFDGSHYGKPYRNVGMNISSDNQIVELAAKDAEFRLRSISLSPQTQKQPQTVNSPNKVSNQDILLSLGRGGASTSSRVNSGTATSRRRVAANVYATTSPKTIAKTKNAQILQMIHGNSPSGTGSPSTGFIPATKPNLPQSSTPQSNHQSITGSQIWIWVLVAIIVFLFLTSH